MTAPLPVLLAVDGGGSKTDVVVVGLDGAVLAHARGPGSSPQVFGLEAALAVLGRVVGEARAAVGEHVLARAAMYVAGLDLPVEMTAFRGAIEGSDLVGGLDGARLLVDNDLFPLLRAGTESADAVAVVCGTGINAMARRADGETARFPALGSISGDWGGGGTLGMQALWHAARAADGRGPDSVLARLVPAAFGVGDVMEVIEGLHLGRIPQRSIAHLTPVLFAAARLGDALARAEIARQAEEIVTMAATAMRRLRLESRAPSVVLGGGVLAAADPLLLEPVREGIAAVAPLARVDLVTAPPIVGAVLLGLEAGGAGPEVLHAARDAVVEAIGSRTAEYEGAIPVRS